jgi:hypothetical protein
LLYRDKFAAPAALVVELATVCHPITTLARSRAAPAHPKGKFGRYAVVEYLGLLGSNGLKVRGPRLDVVENVNVGAAKKCPFFLRKYCFAP